MTHYTQPQISNRKLHIHLLPLLLTLFLFLLPCTTRAADVDIDKVLSGLEQAGKDLKDFTADVSMSTEDPLTGDATILSGKTWYQVKKPGDSRIRVLFDKKTIAGRPDKRAKNEYVLDEGWLVDRDYKNQVEVKRQVLKPGQKMDLLKLGEGPFPLPIGQSPDEVKKMFKVTPVDLEKGDPEGAVKLRLTPLPGTQFFKKFTRVDVVVDPKTYFPIRITTAEKDTGGQESSVHVTDLKAVQTNVGLSDKDFTLEKVQDWKLKQEPMQE